MKISIKTRRRRPLGQLDLGPRRKGIRGHDGENRLEAWPVHHLADLLEVAANQRGPDPVEHDYPAKNYQAGQFETCVEM